MHPSSRDLSTYIVHTLGGGTPNASLKRKASPCSRDIEDGQGNSSGSSDGAVAAYANIRHHAGYGHGSLPHTGGGVGVPHEGATTGPPARAPARREASKSGIPTPSSDGSSA